MWEYTITLPKVSKAKLTNLHQDLSKQCKQFAGVATIINFNQSQQILLACPLYNKNLLKPKVIEILANFILLHFKYDYLVSNFKFKVSNDINIKAFIKALVVFDSDVDKEIIKHHLKRYANIDLNSFYYFKLKPLRIKWNELVNLANDNFGYLMSTDTFVELLKFIISNLDYRTKEVNISFKDNAYELSGLNGEPIDDVLLGDTTDYGDSFLITALITLSPQKIKLHCNTEIKDNTINLIFELFNDRIEIVK